MGRLANISGKEAVKAFQKAGWEVIGQVGSHVVMSKPRISQSLNTKSYQLVRSALSIRNAGLSVDEFLDLL